MAEPEKIIILTHEFYPAKGGIAVYTGEIARGAYLKGLPVEVWAPRHPRLVPDTFPFPVRSLPLRGRQGWPDRLRLARCLYSLRAQWRDAALCLPEPGPLRTWMYLQCLPFPRPKKIIVVLHGSEIERLSRLFYRRYLFRRLLRRAARVGVVSQYNRKRLLELHPGLGDKVVVARGAVRGGLPAPPPREPSPAADGKTAILTVARIHPRKGQLYLMETLAALPPETREKVVCRMAGEVSNPRYFRRLQAFAEKKKLSLEYLGAVEDGQLGAVYQRADIFAMTSLFLNGGVEGFGLVYLEAARHGLPVIAHRTGGVPEAVAHGETGLLAAPGDRRALTEALTGLINNPAKRRQMGDAGRKWAARFSWDDTVERLFGGFTSG